MRSALVCIAAAAATTVLAAGAAFGAATYDKEATEVVLKRAARQVRENCGHAKNENGEAKGPWGKTKVTVKLGHNGRSREATLSPEFNETPTGKCALAAFRNLTFPPWNGPDVVLDWDVEIPQPNKTP
jgi:hypothetical protein